NTGAYPDSDFSHEFMWARHEIYATTHIDSFYVAPSSAINIPDWANVKALGYYTLGHYRKSLTAVATIDTSMLKSNITSLANGFRNVNSSAYGVGVQNGDFYWGSNSVVANEGMVLLQAFNITRDSSYLKAALHNLDYILGRNATNYSFITGHGDVVPMNIHHRVSGADAVEAPVPGLLVGGPNTDATSDCGAASYPSTTNKARAYLDSWCSYSTNEIAINWNAPIAFLAGGIEALYAGGSSTVLTFSPVLPSQILAAQSAIYFSESVKVYPNPAHKELTLQIESKGNLKIQLSDIAGKVLMEENIIETGELEKSFNISNLPQGLYTIQIISEEGVLVKKFVKN
ncbi:MAG: glycoside hydrolase family 9 protein, partial [Cytophagaceae bacterium]|nr:glycoside hydrolase family 9 protein [Cytophagaceae bacterium]